MTSASSSQPRPPPPPPATLHGSSETASETHYESTTHLFKISRYSLLGVMGVGKFVRSAKFSFGGYDWSIKYYPNGYSTATGFVSVFVSVDGKAAGAGADLFSGAMAASLQLCLLDQTASPPAPRNVLTANLFGVTYVGSFIGFSSFIRKSDLDDFLADDSLLVKCSINVLTDVVFCSPKLAAISPAAAAPSELALNLGSLLESKEGADVVFHVGEQEFPAHRCVLAARSPVFRAELFGPMKEHSMPHIVVDDIEPVIFEMLLHFIYTDSLPTEEALPVSMAQHLLVAADRYGVDGMRLLCEERLCRSIDVDNVGTTLSLAAQHHCQRLKECCFAFVVASTADRMAAVVATDGFKHLDASCPLVMLELLAKMRNVMAA